MVKPLNTAEIIAKASRGYIKDYYVDSSQGQGAMSKLLRANQEFNTLLALMEDHTFNSEVNVLVDAILKEGYVINKRGKRSERNISKEQAFERKFRGFKLLRQLFLNLIVYRNGFIEIVYRNKTADELHILETTEMNINVTPHGEVIGYTQIHESGPFAPKGVVFFNPEECVHIAPSRISTNPWGYVDTRSIIPIVKNKQALENYIYQLFQYDKFRNWWNISKASSAEQIKNFISSLKEGRQWPEKDIVTEGEISTSVIRSPTELVNYTQLLDNYKASIREFLRVPPIMVGDVNSNKSSGEFQVRYAFDNSVISWQRIVEDEINNELFPTMGWGNYEINFNPIDKPSEKAAIENAVQLKGLGYTDDTINEYLLSKGVTLPAEAKIKTPEEKAKEQEAMMANDNEIIGKKLQNMNAKSRKPSDKKLDKTKEVENVTTREDQKVGK